MKMQLWFLMLMDDITSKHIFVFPLVCLGVSFFEAMDPHTVSLIPSGQGLIHLYGNDTKILVHSQNVQCRTYQYMEVVGCRVRKAGFCKGGRGGGWTPQSFHVLILWQFLFLSCSCPTVILCTMPQQDSKDTFKVHSKTVALQNIITYCNYCNKKLIIILKNTKQNKNFKKITTGA